MVHFRGLKWTPTTEADWSTFAADFQPDASLFPAARPARAKTLDEFIERMNSVAQGSLRSFEERTSECRSSFSAMWRLSWPHPR